LGHARVCDPRGVMRHGVYRFFHYICGMKSAGILTRKGVKPTPNRLLVLDALLRAASPMSLADLETDIDTMDRSSIFRTLAVFVSHDIAHSIDDGSGSVKYEVCHGEDHCSVDDMHVHFYCESCHRTVCFEDLHIPTVPLPEDYTPRSVTYLVKGICPACARSKG